MAETLTELIAKISTDAAGLKSGLSDAEKQTEVSSKRMQDSLKKVGMAMAASGAAITGALGLMGKAALDEEINMKRLATTINNSGTAYDSVKDSMEALIATTQRKTGIADDEQRNILNRLILVTNDYGKAMELLPTVLDLAAAGEMDATTAATYLGKAYLDLEKGADSVSVRFGQASLQFKSMEDIQNRVAGSAETLANPLSVLKASIGDVAEAIGMNLLPIMKDTIDKVVDIAVKVQDWVNENPKLAKTLTMVAGALGVVLTVVGGLILILPTLISGVAAFGVVFHVALGPIGLISLAISGLIAWITWLIVNMDKMIHFWDDVFSNMKIIALTAIDTILASLENLIGWMPILGDKIRETRNDLANMIRVEKIVKDARDTRDALKDVGEALEEITEIVELNTDATREQTEAAQDNIDALKAQQDELLSTTAKLKNMQREYEYARSDAGRLGVSIKDVTFALFDQGKTVDEVAQKMSLLGDDADDVNKVLEAFGLTAQEVNDILKAQKDAIDATTDAYNKQGEAAKLAASAIKRGAGGYILPTGITEIETGMSPEQIAFSKGWDWENLTPSQYEEVVRFAGSPPGYATGGIVPGPIGMPQLATVHGGETIIPANESIGGVTVNFTQPVFFDREDTMNRFVDMIRKGIQRQDRLRFGGAYNG